MLKNMILSSLSRLVSRLWQTKARALQKEVSPVFKSVERRYNRMADDKPKKYTESLRLMSIGFINDNLDGVIEYADAAVDALENATADANEVKDISYNN